MRPAALAALLALSGCHALPMAALTVGMAIAADATDISANVRAIVRGTPVYPMPDQLPVWVVVMP